MRTRLALGAAALACAVGAAPAAANGTLTFSQSSLNFAAGDVETNAVNASWSGASLIITDTGDEIDTAVAGCNGSGTNTVTCNLGQPATQFTIDVKDGNDAVTVSGSDFLRVIGGDGSDQLTVNGPLFETTNVYGDDFNSDPIGDGNDNFTGGPADDQVGGAGGVDVLLGGEGDDHLVGGLGDGDRVEGGPGEDSAFHSVSHGTGDVYDGGPGTDELDLDTAEFVPPFIRALSVDLLAGTAVQTAGGSFSVTATSYEDLDSCCSPTTASGTDTPNFIRTFDGDDVIDPRGGPDRVDVAGGADRLQLRDGFADLALCGAGADSVEADQLDELFDCESIERQSVRPAGVDAERPACRFAKLRSRVRRRAFLRGLAPTLRCSEQATVLVRLAVPVRRRRGRLVTARAGDLVLAERRVQAGTVARRVRLTVPRRLRRVLGRRFTATLTATARDEFGNTRRVTRRVRVR